MRHKTQLTGWGRFPVTNSYLVRPERICDLEFKQNSLISRGLGRSYGDAALNTERDVVLMQRLNRFRSFDEKTGIIRAEAGATLEEILNVFVPRGWFLPVTPGTKQVTLGGCFAADIHGKNHHMDGTFSRYISDIEVLLAEGSKIRCSPSDNSQAFWATAGGMGLTGIITELALQLIPVETAYLCVKHLPAKNLDALLEILADGKQDDRYSVAWIDCFSQGEDLGRGVVMNGHHAKAAELPSQMHPFQIKKRTQYTIPSFFPGSLLNSYAIKGFNALYYRLQSRKQDPFFIDYDHYFYPLDAVGNWNRLYGRKGFLQYQFVVPAEGVRQVLCRVWEAVRRFRKTPFLAVLKRFGPENEGYLSFPMEGYTLAIDFPLSDAELFSLLDLLDEIVLEYGGRVYLAKDARMKPVVFKKMYPHLEEWQRVKNNLDPKQRFSSDLSRRLEITL